MEESKNEKKMQNPFLRGYPSLSETPISTLLFAKPTGRKVLGHEGGYFIQGLKLPSYGSEFLRPI